MRIWRIILLGLGVALIGTAALALTSMPSAMKARPPSCDSVYRPMLRSRRMAVSWS